MKTNIELFEYVKYLYDKVEVLEKYVCASLSTLKKNSSQNFTYKQLTDSTTWNIKHDLNYIPNITILDNNEEELFGQITYTDLNNLILTFSEPVSGTAYLS